MLPTRRGETEQDLRLGRAAVRPALWRPTLGLFTYGAGDPNSHTVWAGVAAAAQEYGANLICFPGKPLHSEHEFEAQSNVLYDLAGPTNIDGLVLWLSGLTHLADSQEIRAFCARYRGLALATCGVLVEGIPGVVVDNYGAMRAVVAHMIEAHGHRRIAFIRGPERHQEAEVRYRAYCDALGEHGIPIDPGCVVPGNFKESGGLAAIEELLDVRRVRFEALVAASDNMALGAMKALQARGVRIPTDVAIAGLNDESQSASVTPPLTTGPLHFYEQAHKATAMVLALLRGERVPERVVLPAQLRIRQSCGCPDPVVVQAAAARVAAEPVTPAGCLDAARPTIMAELTRTLEASEESPSAPQVAGLLDGFLADTAMEGHGSFLAALDEALRQTAAAGRPISQWHGVISALRSAVLACGIRGDAAAHAENLFQQARVLTGETAQRVQAHELLQAEEQARTLSRINQMLSTSVDVDALCEILAEALPRLHIPRCYLSIYEDPAAPTASARLIVAYDPDGRACLDRGGTRFPSSRLVPGALLPADERYSLVVEPLHFRQDQLGFIVFEGDPRKEEVYEILRGEISGALKRTQLIAHNLELYDEAVEARRVAERGRQLAEEANQLKSRFLATVSHELRTPLSLIAGTIEMMPRQDAPGARLPESYRRDLNSIRAGAQHLSHLIGDVLDLASSQAGELHLASEPLQPAEVLARVAMLGEPLAREKGLAWQAVIPADLPLVSGDRTRLQQAILNLVSNAVKFTERGSITLWAESGKRSILVAVSDTGMGIPAGEQEVIFDEFRQSARSTRRGYGGMGLGLAISRRLIELHGGQIGVLSSGTDGAGSTFYFTLPVVAPAVPEQPATEDWSQRVLLFTERPGEASPLGEHLAARGFQVEVRSIGDSPDWLGKVIASPPGAVVLDYQPAAERGWELMRMLKANPDTQDIPVLFYSLSGNQSAGSLLAVDYLAKPISREDLVRALARQGVERGPGKRKTVLIVDDEPGILDLHARIVQAQLPACLIRRAHNGVEALASIAQTLPDLVLLDLMMPEMDGFAVLQAMRADQCAARVPVIVLTAQVLTQEDMARLQSGVAAVLGKDLFTPEEVLVQVEAALACSKRLGSDAQRIVRQAMAYIHEHYAEPLSREDLAGYFGLSERYLTRCFRQETGVTPITYLNRYRILQARALLERGNLSVTEVALASGFSDSNYFGRMFQREVGINPGAYKRGQRSPLP